MWYYRRERDGELMSTDSFIKADNLIAKGFSRIGREVWREYKRKQKELQSVDWYEVAKEAESK